MSMLEYRLAVEGFLEANGMNTSPVMSWADFEDLAAEHGVAEKTYSINREG